MKHVLWIGVAAYFVIAIVTREVRCYQGGGCIVLTHQQLGGAVKAGVDAAFEECRK